MYDTDKPGWNIKSHFGLQGPGEIQTYQTQWMHCLCSWITENYTTIGIWLMTCSHYQQHYQYLSDDGTPCKEKTMEYVAVTNEGEITNNQNAKQIVKNLKGSLPHCSQLKHPWLPRQQDRRGCTHQEPPITRGCRQRATLRPAGACGRGEHTPCTQQSRTCTHWTA